MFSVFCASLLMMTLSGISVYIGTTCMVSKNTLNCALIGSKCMLVDYLYLDNYLADNNQSRAQYDLDLNCYRFTETCISSECNRDDSLTSYAYTYVRHELQNDFNNQLDNIMYATITKNPDNTTYERLELA